MGPGAARSGGRDTVIQGDVGSRLVCASFQLSLAGLTHAGGLLEQRVSISDMTAAVVLMAWGGHLWRNGYIQHIARYAAIEIGIFDLVLVV